MDGIVGNDTDGGNRKLCTTLQLIDDLRCGDVGANDGIGGVIIDKVFKFKRHQRTDQILYAVFRRVLILIFQKTITIKNKKIRRLFIPKNSKLYKDMPEENREKMVVIPFVLGAIPVIYIPIRLFIEAEKIMEKGQVGFVLDTDAVFNFLLFSIALGAFSAALLLLNTFKCYKTEKPIQTAAAMFRLLLFLVFTLGFLASLYFLCAM